MVSFAFRSSNSSTGQEVTIQTQARTREGGAFKTEDRGQTRLKRKKKKKKGEETKETVSMKNKTNHTTGCKSHKNKATTKQNFKDKKKRMHANHGSEEHMQQRIMVKRVRTVAGRLPCPAFPPVSL